MEIKYANDIYEMDLEEVRDYHNNLVNFLDGKKATPVQAGSVRCARRHYEKLKKGSSTASQKTTGSSKNHSKADHSNSKVLDFYKGNAEHKQHPIDEQFLPLGYESFFDNEVLVSRLANKTMLYLILMKNKIDWQKNEKLNLYQEYFIKQRKIVASLSRLQLAKMMNRSPRTISYWLGQLKNDGLIKIDRVHCDEEDDRRKKYNVYILGEVMKDGSHRFYGHEK